MDGMEKAPHPMLLFLLTDSTRSDGNPICNGGLSLCTCIWSCTISIRWFIGSIFANHLTQLLIQNDPHHFPSDIVLLSNCIMHHNGKMENEKTQTGSTEWNINITTCIPLTYLNACCSDCVKDSICGIGTRLHAYAALLIVHSALGPKCEHWRFVNLCPQNQIAKQNSDKKIRSLGTIFYDYTPGQKVQPEHVYYTRKEKGQARKHSKLPPTVWLFQVDKCARFCW